ncbi:transposase [Rhizobium sp. CF080]|uniref:transposase n=1 Tax=Rhizobium sp. (strain CF080) TaxID=1144310 RepID=UPI0024780ACE|nr:transposase [Rhizobium sp. CF080]
MVSRRPWPHARSRPAFHLGQTAKSVIPHDPTLYKKRHKIENMFGRLKDWRRIHTRYDRCAHTYFSSICIAAAVIFWM